MCSPSPPPAPDYGAAAEATAKGNLEAARFATKANRINQFTPYGSLTYSQTPVQMFDEDAYNKALEAYQRSGTPTSQTQTVYDPISTTYNTQTVNVPGSPVGNAPRREDFMVNDPDAGWTQNVNLTPEAQATLDQTLALNRKYGETANVGFDRVREMFENPALDTSGIPQRALNVGQTAQEAILSRLNPQFSQQEEQLRQRLANQGITLGSEAYTNEMRQQQQARTDRELQAALQGINLDMLNRQGALQEQAYLQDRPLNLINALRSGAQVQNPQFTAVPQQATTAGPNYSQAAQQQYGAALDQYNAEGSPLGGLFSLGMGLAGLPGANGSIIKGVKGLFG